MKITNTLVFILSVVTSSAFAGKEGGGGIGVYCQKNGHKSVQSLDLYEAKNIWGYPVPASKTLDYELGRVMPLYWSAANDNPTRPVEYQTPEFFKRMYHEDFLNLFHFIPAGSRLKLTDDATLTLDLPRGCKYVQVLKYLDEGTTTGGIDVDKEYWRLVDPENRVAFALHEFNYKVTRDDLGIRNSDAVRKMIGALFSLKPYPSPFTEVRSASSALECRTVGLLGDNPNWSAGFFVTTWPSFSGPAGTALYFNYFGRFGVRQGPVMYRAFSAFPYENLHDNLPIMSGGGAETLEINSILGGEKVDLIQSSDCQPGQSSNCKTQLFLSKALEDGSIFQRELKCQPVALVK